MAGRPIDQLPGVMRNLSRRIGAASGVIARAAAGAIHQSLVENTPVDTGKARSNWVAQAGSPFGGEIPPYAPGSKLGINEAANAAAAIAQGKNAIERLDGVDVREVYITNNVPYIGKLNAGSSSQQPASFVERAVQAGLVAGEAAAKKALG